MVQEKDCGAYVPIHCITDCKDLYDRLMREGAPKAPTEKKLAIDLAGPRQILMTEAWRQSRTDSKYEVGRMAGNNGEGSSFSPFQEAARSVQVFMI